MAVSGKRPAAVPAPPRGDRPSAAAHLRKDAEAVILDLIGKVYDAALDEKLWPDLAPRIARTFDSTSTAVRVRYMRDGRLEHVIGLALTANYDDPIAERYESYYAERDVWVERARRIGISKVVASKDIISDAEFERTEVCQDLCRPLGYFYMVGAVFPISGDAIGVIGIHRPRQAGGYTLTPGTPYAIDLKAETLRNPSGPMDNPNIAAQSDSYFDFTPTASPYGVPVYLPTVDPTTGGYRYSMTVAAGTEYFIDPSIATGYAYQTGAGNPNFASVELPDIQSDPFDLSWLDGSSWLNTLVAPGATFDFPDGGVASFDVTGIDPSLMLDPGDTTAFLTGLTFTADGSFTGTQTPITEDVPEPSSLLLFASALAGLVAARRRRALA